ncbi:ATV_HP_G0043170.mRNA.1.CDS.1 [Saccharomyces cerevisiae]|nr:ATV_HP_G0095940.mRNA.1.CDS.1 [Saccharomyces cerevisiae]CAI5020661.1 ATV_HP_G0006110.mRNA.1.CDS.1 [Saccharomyces cerevisiae]CAI5113757.1 ATV_HP_G0043170.mRNA.1.CDS.1 [Saccharomyces cerevisiae]CAI6538727.1 ATV_HP_G0095940.mRNA.1.CDS.1 [Saccharomyces cerevisiae]CAI6632119.1 AAC_HP1_G0034160.mRNA.1.CDS.1 [Saccharomyces cerevisiae]
MSSSKFEEVINKIINDSPPGELREVYDDLIKITSENSKNTVLDAIENYNVQNCIPIEVNGNSVIISKYNKEGAKFFDPVNSVIFSVNHLERKGLDIEPYEFTHAKIEKGQLKELHDKLHEYLLQSFPGDVSFAVYPVPEEISKISIIIVSTKYNPNNFWNGHWRSSYIYDLETRELSGQISTQVHYYEDGNVSFQSGKDINQSNVDDVVCTIRDIETNFENDLDLSFFDLNEKQFKALRRRLPVTRSKINWGSAIGSYRLGKNAAEGK